MENRNVYKGHRYVPKIMGVWDKLKAYEGLSIVTWEGVSYTSKKRVPEGVEITNEEYWVVTGNYDAQVENYRQDVDNYNTQVENYRQDVVNYRDEVGGYKEETDEQLAQIAINPDDFEGTDHEKMQQSIDLAIEENKGIRLSRMFDLTGEEPLLNSKEVYWNRMPIYFIGLGGGFIKNDSGYLFSANGNNMGDLHFQNVRFNSVAGAGTKLFNGDRLIRNRFDNCTFRDVDTILDAPTRFIQSYYFMGGSIIGGQGNAFEMYGGYDLRLGGGLLVEHRDSLFKQLKNEVGIPATAAVVLSNFTFRDITVEGLTGRAFHIRRTENLLIDGVYLETNANGHIHFDDDSELINVKIANCRIYEGKDSPVNEAIHWGGRLYGVSSENNTAKNISLHNTSNIIDGEVNTINDVSFQKSGDQVTTIPENDEDGVLYDSRVVILSNEDYVGRGNITRFADGSQICSIKDFELTYENTALLSGVWSVPLAFTDHSNIQATVSLSSYADIGALSEGYTKAGGALVAYAQRSSVRVNLFTNGQNFLEGEKVRVNIIAVGRWK